MLLMTYRCKTHVTLLASENFSSSQEFQILHLFEIYLHRVAVAIYHL